MLRVDNTRSLPVEAATELRDALGRRQKELPPRWLATVDAAKLADGSEPTGHALEAIERELGLALLRGRLADARPRGILCVRPSASAANTALVESLCGRGSVTTIAVAELDDTVATSMLARVVPRGVTQSTALACDCTVDLPVPARFPHPRVYLVLGNVLGSTTAVGAVRMLRILRTTMTPGDDIVLGLDARRGATAPSPANADDLETSATRHLGALELLNSTAGARFDLGRFDFRPMFDAENSRAETHLVARKACEVAVPGVCDVRLRKGESIRTSVSCVFDRGRVAAMMGGVGLTLREWTTDPESRFVVALAGPAV
jgi:uncharacterized SAM-dependent methyltransferase